MDTIGKLKVKAKNWINELSNSSREYSKFLDFSKQFYRYKIYEILAMYVQNPNITACADKNTWKKIERKVINEKDVIYAFDYTYKWLKYNKLYDVSNTSGKVDVNKFIWNYNPELDIKIKEHFGESFEKIIESRINYNYVNSKDYIEFKHIVIKSTMYLINSKCDKKPNIELNFDYEILKRYFYEVSINIGDIAKPILDDIGKIINTENLNEKGYAKPVKETLHKRINEVENAIEENTSKTYTDYRVLIGRTFIVENKRYRVDSINDRFVEAENLDNEFATAILLRTFRIETVIDILEPEVKQIELQEIKNQEPIDDKGSFFIAENNIQNEDELIDVIDSINVLGEDIIDIFDIKNYKEPFVVIEWSENIAFQNEELLTFREADLKFKEVERIFNDSGTKGYDKTKGIVYHLNDDRTRLLKYEFRYDIGDYELNESGLYNHIKGFWEYEERQTLKNSEFAYSKEDVEQGKAIVSKLEFYQDTTFLDKIAQENSIVVEQDGNIELKNEVVGSHNGQLDMEIGVFVDKEIRGYIQYSVYENKAHLNWIEVHEEHRHKGYGTLMINQLYKENENVNWGILTDDGIAFQKAITTTVRNPEYTEKSADLRNSERIIKEYESMFPDQELTENEMVDYYKHVDNVRELKNDIFDINELEIKFKGISTKNKLSEREKLHENIEVIKLLKLIEDKGRNATYQEKETLKKYHGFGGISDVFDYSKDKYRDERIELNNLLTDKEYKQAEGSTLNAHYTSKEIIETMYATLEQMGFKGQNSRLLEPSLGSGRFFEHIPKSLAQSKLYGVELDSITGRIAKQLYPEADIQIKGFEETNFTDNYFDIVIGNVPFGDYGVYDDNYKKHSLVIHDYFIAKSLDKVKEGGIVAVVTSNGTLDKKTTSARELISAKGALIGAIRLPNTAFKESANTEVVTDILFFQKGAKQNFDWINTRELEFDGEYFPINNYFIENPQMVIGDFKKISGRYGNDVTVSLDKNSNFIEELKKATELLPSNIFSLDNTIPIDTNIDNLVNIQGYENVKEFCYIVHNNELYYKNNYGIVKEEKLKGIKLERVIGQVELKNLVREILDMQMNLCSDEELIAKQEELNTKYDTFVKKYGYVSDNANKSVFRDDSDAPLLLSIENFVEDNEYSKGAIFFDRTIAPTQIVEYAENSVEALLVCLNNKGYVDIDYMAKISENTKENIINELGDKIFKNPAFKLDSINEKEYIIKSKYLSGNVLKKIEIAKMFVEEKPEYEINIKALEEVKPIELIADEIRIGIGMNWIPIEYYKDFICDLLEVTEPQRNILSINYSIYSGRWGIANSYINNVNTNTNFGTKRISAIKIFEDTLNLKNVKIYDTVENAEGNKIQVLNEAQTEIAQAKQKLIKEKFDEWLYADEDRENNIVKIYNQKFNNTVLENFDGSHLTFYGMTNKIDLREHQKNAVHRILSNGNTLLHHEVGSGKTFTIVTVCMEQKRLGMINKPMIVVPNHLVDQWSSEFMRLYPNANILAVGQDDMSKDKRLLFTSRIATGNYDSIIISHSSFEKIPVSKEYRENMLNQEIEEIENALSGTDDRHTVKDLNRILKSKETQLKKLNNESEKDNVLDFEDLGVDSLFVDEAHLYKNLFAFSKLSRVAGVNSSFSQRATDMFLKCQLINNEINKSNKGIVFATGTPISNSISELYVMQKYLMSDTLKESDLHFFDNWVANFGEIVVKHELSPSGQGYKPRERLATFKNIPELMCLYKEVADVVTLDMINIELPKLKDNKITIVSSKPSSELKEFTNQLVKRAEDISLGGVDPTEDNMLVITNDGRKAGLDMRLIDEMYEDNPNSKINKCIDNIFEVWGKTIENKSTQLVFCDMSTPKTNSQDLKSTDFNIYVDIRNKLLKKGVPRKEIAFIHDCKTDIQKEILFEKVRKGDVRVLLGSTQKCGAGTNIQDKLVALHDIDCPWRPADLQQRLGRIVRQGNENKEVEVFRYVTEESFDAYLWSIVETKAKFIDQIMRGDTTIRHFTDDSEIVLSYGEITAIASGNPLIKTSIELKTKLKELRTLEVSHIREQKEMKNIIDNAPEKIENLENSIKNITMDIEIISKNNSDNVLVNGKYFDKPSEQGEALLSLAKDNNMYKNIGEIAGLKIQYVGRDSFTQAKKVALVGQYKMELSISNDGLGTVTRIKNTLNKYVNKQTELIEKLEKNKKDFVMAKNSFGQEWIEKDKLKETEKELERIEKILYATPEISNIETSKDNINYVER